MILDDIQSQHTGDLWIGGYICQFSIQFSLLIMVPIFLFSGGQFETISNNMKTMSNILILIFCI